MDSVVNQSGVLSMPSNDEVLVSQLLKQKNERRKHILWFH